MSDVPLIYTSKGNLPLESLAYSTQWEDTDTYTKLIETYRLGDEIVKQSCHVLTKQSLTAAVEQGVFHG